MVPWINEEKMQFISPVASFANHLLNGDWSKGEQGLLVRTFDKTLANIDDSSLFEVLERHGIPTDLLRPIPTIKYVPSSYLHASIRAPGAIYQESIEEHDPDADFTIMVGTKFVNNTSMERFQRNSSLTVGCDFIYSLDGTAVERGSIFGKEYCWPGRLESVCVEGECMTKRKGACGVCQVDPAEHGDFLSRWAETVANRTLVVPWSASCYYESFGDAVVASASLWEERERWLKDKNPDAYFGYTECASELTIRDVDIADAIVLPMHRTSDPLPQTQLQHHGHMSLENRLQHAYRRGYGDLPVIWYRETVGIHSAEDCERLFNGRNCKDAWQKDFFSSEYMFHSKSCLYKPPGCKETYFFLADGNVCSAVTDKGKERSEYLRKIERKRDARIAYEEIFSERRHFPAGPKEPFSKQPLLTNGSHSKRRVFAVGLSVNGPSSVEYTSDTRSDESTARFPPLSQAAAMMPQPAAFLSTQLTCATFFFLGMIVPVFFGPRKIRP